MALCRSHSCTAVYRVSRGYDHCSRRTLLHFGQICLLRSLPAALLYERPQLQWILLGASWLLKYFRFARRHTVCIHGKQCKYKDDN